MLLKEFKYSLTNFKELINAPKIPFYKIIGYLFFLSAILAIPVTLQMSQIFNDIKADGQKIAEKLPDFTIEDGQMQNVDEDEGFIYQTDSIIFTFDPAGKRNAQDIQSDMLGNFLSIGLLEDRLVINFANTEVSSSLFGDNEIEISYDEEFMQNLSGAHIHEYLDNSSIPWFIYLIAYLVAVYPTMISLAFGLLFATLAASFYSKAKQFNFTYFETLKIMSLAATLPVLLATLIELFIPHFATESFIFLASVFIFAQVIKVNSPKLSK
ncbi:MAG: DUF1189 domain-containing protein [Enterococcus sp.]